MTDQPEKLWDYDAVEPGQSGGPVVVTITNDDISWYALLAENISSQFTPGDGCDDECDDERQEWPSVAMPTMVLTYAPLLLEEIAAANGFVALEWSKTSRHQTPFAKCEIQWHNGVMAGDVVTSTRRVLEKYVRRGNKFVTFRVEAVNQDGEEVAQYDYTCVFEFAEDRNVAPRSARKAEPSLSVDGTRDRYSWEPLKEVGDRLTDLRIQQSQDEIREKEAYRLAGRPTPNKVYTDEALAREGIFGGPVVSGAAAMSYVDQLLLQHFTLGSFYGGSLLLRAIEPFRAGDTVTFRGSLTFRGEETAEDGDSQRVVQCLERGINQRGELVNLSEATLVLRGLEAK